MQEKLICPLCGEPTSIYMGNARKDKLCRMHGKLANAGKIEQCPSCGKWHNIGEVCDCKYQNKVVEQKRDNICIFCSQKTNKKFICNDCWQEINNHFSTLDKNNSYIKLKDYYYNLKNYIFRINNSDNENLNYYLTKLYAIAILTKKLYGKEDLCNKIFDDIRDIKEKNNKNQNIKISENDKLEREINIAGVNRTDDGHFVKSELEVKIDDILYGLRLCHVYEKKVSKILERTVICDWFIPVIGNYGVYIELWGIENDKKYSLNKEEKRALYKKYDIPLIEIEKDELKGDSRGLADRIESEFERLKAELKSKY